MSAVSREEVTTLLIQQGEGPPPTDSDLLPLVYEELRSLAASYLNNERQGHTLQPTALVHEAYLRLVDQTRVRWQDRTHFFAVAAMCMRRILINHARDRNRLKRGGGMQRVALTELTAPGNLSDQALLTLDEALKRLAELDERKARVVEFRYFAGLSVEQTAELLGASPATVGLAWTLHRPGVTAPIIGPRTVDQLDDAFAAAELELDAATMTRLDEIWPGPGAPAPTAYAW